MRAKLQKLSANKDQKDSIQFQMKEDDVDDYKEQIMALRRYDNVTVKAEGEQSQIGEKGAGFPTFKFKSINTSISLCVTEKGIIATLTFSFEDPNVFDAVINNKLRDQWVRLEFKKGENPYS